MIVLPVSWALMRHQRVWRAWILLASYIFYAWWDWRFVFLLAATTVIDFFAVKRLDAAGENEPLRRRWMIFSVSVNLAVLGFFKYFNFFEDSGVSALKKIGLNLPTSSLKFILP